MSIAQGFMLSQEAQSAFPTAGIWSYESSLDSGMYMPTGAPNFANIFPGTQDFCWETWIQPLNTVVAFTEVFTITAWQSGGNSPGPSASNFSLYFDKNANGTGLMTVRAKLFGDVSTVIKAVSQATIFDGGWHHLAMSRSGTTVSVWFNGELYGLIEGNTSNLTQANVASDGYWMTTGPTGDRDESFFPGLAARCRNTRWTIGNAVYSIGSTITPPSLVDQLPAVTGTQWVWWPNNTTNAFYYASGGLSNPWSPDLNPGNYQFTSVSGSTSGASVCPAGLVLPTNQTTTPTPFQRFEPQTTGTWTSPGTGGSQPTITTSGPPGGPIIETACGNFTATGTDVRISSTNSALLTWNNSFFMTLWIYVPAAITNECKTLIYCSGTTDGFVLNIGRPGQGLDWLSVYNSGDTELAYAPCIWARNAWNYITIQQDTGNGSTTNGAISAWAGANGDSYARNLNMTTLTAPWFGGTTVSIGCKPGSAVSCQMYVNLIQQTCGVSNYGTSIAYDSALALIPMQTWQYRKLVPGEIFTFQGTNGSTNIQPLELS
jgi:hypothetical protein